MKDAKKKQAGSIFTRRHKSTEKNSLRSRKVEPLIGKVPHGYRKGSEGIGKIGASELDA